MFRTVGRRLLNNTRAIPRFTRRNQSSSKRFAEDLGDRPRYFENASKETKGKIFPFIALIFGLPLVFVPLYTRYWIEYDIQNGDPELKEFEAYREERNKRLAAKRAAKDAADEELTVSAPVTNKQIPDAEYKYVLIGGGPASYHAYKAIRENDPNATILIISEDSYAPYQRPPLSKELWQSESEDAEKLIFSNWDGKKIHVEYEPKEAYENQKNVTLMTNSKVVELDTVTQTVKLANGKVFQYDKCLIATGGTPREIPGSEALPKNRISTFRTLDDFKNVYRISKSGADIVVVGGSFLGTELAYALGSHKMKQRQEKNKYVGTVSQVYLEPEVLARNLPRYLSEVVRDALNSVGVNLKPNRNVVRVALEKRPKPGSTNSQERVEKVVVYLDNGEELVADFVLTATGIFPNTELAENTGLEIDPVNGGIVTNAELEAKQNVFVAGDVASYYDVVLGRRRYEHYEHATATGRHAGLNMSSSNMKPFRHISMFWSDIGKTVSFQAVGEIKSDLDTYGVWDGVVVSQNGTSWNNAPAPLKNESFKRGIVYYLRDNRVVGVLLWNIDGPNIMRDARKVILQKKQYHDLSELRNLIQMN
jgi:programmed cell death 8 (apoptosis-inducing factor)